MRGEITLRKTLEEYKTVYMAYRNFAERTREEYLNDLEDLVEFLEKSGIHKVGELELAQFERYLSELTRLQLDDLDFADNNGFARIRGGRGREDRMLPLNNRACIALKAYLQE